MTGLIVTWLIGAIVTLIAGYIAAGCSLASEVRAVKRGPVARWQYVDSRFRQQEVTDYEEILEARRGVKIDLLALAFMPLIAALWPLTGLALAGRSFYVGWQHTKPTQAELLAQIEKLEREAGVK